MFSLLSIFFLIDVSSVGNKDVLLNRYISLVTKIKTPSKVVIFKKTKTYRQRLLFAERGKFFLDNKKNNNNTNGAFVFGNTFCLFWLGTY